LFFGATAQILSTLNEQQVHATFFVTRAELEQNIEEGKRIVAAGHELGNQSYSHKRMFSFKTVSELLATAEKPH
jgi:peptidoglycan/xylan/chitin deacetylase (PgdA/CDA1 family)